MSTPPPAQPPGRCLDRSFRPFISPLNALGWVVMDGLPSYEDATTAPHWLQLVAPYVRATDWRRCSLVDSRFYQHFAPRLWLDPLITVRIYGLHHNDDLAWYRRFTHVHIKSVRSSTRALVRSLDFRDFAIVASGLYSTDASERAISESFKDLPDLFPRLLCLLISGHSEISAESLVWASGGHTKGVLQDALQLLDLAHCLHPLTTRFFQSPYLKDLVYLDISSLPGSIGSTVQASLNPQYLSGLRVLKVRGREVDDATASVLLQNFGRQLWSLDLSDNKLTDITIATLIESSFSSLSFRTDAHFESEGKLVNPQQTGTKTQGPFEFILESKESSTFTHPMRYMPDAPPYIRRGSQQELQEWQVVRSTGLNPRRDDSADAVRTCLLNDLVDQATSSESAAIHDIRAGQGGITHLYLNGNQFTSAGIQKLIRCSQGRLEHFECDSSIFPNPIPNTPKSLQISGLFGLSHLFRPVISSNIRSIRVHHSLVTQIPDVSGPDISSVAAIIQAETYFRDRIQMVYPQAFVPDMNPRLQSLTLTGLPRRSTGPLISAIIKFLDFATRQQRAVEHAIVPSMQRGSATLKGLRHIRLELLPEQSEELDDMLSLGEVNFDELLDPASPVSGGGQNSYLGTNSNALSTHRDRDQVGTSTAAPNSNSIDLGTVSESEQDALRVTEQGHWIYRVDASHSWTGNMFTLPVWTGSGLTSPRPAVNEYMVNLRDQRLRTNIGPAMPNHVAAGVPANSYIFHAAWDAMVFPPSLPEIDRKLLDRMKDIATAIKEYRIQTKGTERHWMGRLELARMPHVTKHQSFGAWR